MRLSPCQESFLCSTASTSLQDKVPFLQDLSGSLIILHPAGTSEIIFLCLQIFLPFQGNCCNELWYCLVKLRKFKGVRKCLGVIFLNPEQSHNPFLMWAAWWALADLDEEEKPYKAQVYNFPLGSTQVGAI